MIFGPSVGLLGLPKDKMIAALVKPDEKSVFVDLSPFAT